MEDRYVILKLSDIPAPLLSQRNKTFLHCNHLLWTLKIMNYVVKCCPIKLRCSVLSVEEKISQLDDINARSRCQMANDYLVTSNDSSYLTFVELRETLLANNNKINLFNFNETKGIECALWPHLYPFTFWCESALTDDGSRLSRKVTFNFKLFSEIIDYSLHYDLLQFHYHRWLYKTVSDAVNTARRLGCSPARALDSKLFSHTYWQWQHQYVLDAVEQFGLPDCFVTLSPFEWSVPFSK